MKRVILILITLSLFTRCNQDTDCDPIRNMYFAELKEAPNEEAKTEIQIRYFESHPECFDCESATRLYFERLEIAESESDHDRIRELKERYLREHKACAELKGISK